MREFKQTIERMAIHYDGPLMRAAWWDRPPEPSEITRPPSRPPFAAHTRETPVTEPHYRQPQPAAGLPMNRKQRYAEATRLLRDSDNDLGWVASRLGIHPTTLYRWRKDGKV